MSAMANPFPQTSATWSLPDRGKVAMAGLIIAESAIFTIFVVAYLFYVGKESHRTDSARSARDTDLLHHLPVVEQPDHSFCREVAGTRQSRSISRLMGAHHRFGRHVYVRHWAGVAPADLRTRAHHLDEFIRNDLLLAGRTARLSRHRRPAHAADCCDICFGWPRGRASSRVAWKCSRCTGILSMSCGSWFSPSFTFWGAEGKKWQPC